jgi:hypothetical protein
VRKVTGGTDNGICIDAGLRPLGNTVAAHPLLFCSLGGLENFPRMPVAEWQPLEEAEELGGTAVIKVPVKAIKPRFVARVLVAHIEHKVAAISDTSRDRKLMVRGHDDVQAIWHLATTSKLAFKLEV